MKTYLPQRYVPKGWYPFGHSGTEKHQPVRNRFVHACAGSIIAVSLSLCGSALAVQPPAELLTGRLFYTPAQRAMLVNARTHKVTEIQKSYAPPASAPISLDGVITRSDGVATHWVNGRPQTGRPTANVRSLKPGQTRAHQKVYEPYQLMRPGDVPKAPSTTVPPAPDNGAAP